MAYAKNIKYDTDAMHHVIDIMYEDEYKWTDPTANIIVKTADEDVFWVFEVRIDDMIDYFYENPEIVKAIARRELSIADAEIMLNDPDVIESNGDSKFGNVYGDFDSVEQIWKISGK